MLLDWTGQQLNDNELLGKLHRLGRDVNYIHIHLNQNNLSQVPNFLSFRSLETLHLGLNQINVAKPGYVPESLMVLDLSYNYLAKVPDLHNHWNLRRLDVRNNKITAVDPSHLPLSVTDVNLSANQLSALPNFSQHKQLLQLNVGNNKNLGIVDLRYIPKGVTDLNLGGTRMREVPNFSQYHNDLKTLGLANNNISVIPHSYIPYSVMDLNLSHNQLSEVPYFSEHQNLTMLNLANNNIGAFNPSHIPCTVTDLNMSSTQLSDLPDISPLSGLHKLNLTYNPNLHRIQGLPHSCLDLQINSNIEVLGMKCFHQENFSVLKKALNLMVLRKPPVAMLSQGVDAVLEYYTEKSARSTQNRMVLLGSTTAGKSSLMETLIAQRSVLANISARTQVADIKGWDISDVDTIQIYDQGGQEIYNITTPIFVTANSIVLLLHDLAQVSDENLNETSSILHQALQQYPDNQIHVVLTHSDLVDDAAALESNEKVIRAALEGTMVKEMQGIDKDAKSKEDRESSKSLSSQLEKQKDNMKYFLISSKTYKGIDDLRHFLAQMAIDKRQDVPEKWIAFYKMVMAQNKKFWRVEELQNMFVSLYSKIEKTFQKSKILSRFKIALWYFNNAGQILFYENVPLLNEYAFHKPQFIIDLLKSCFHHDLKSFLNYEIDLALQHSFPRVQFELMINQYQQEGLLHKKLLQFLWQKHNLDDGEQDALLEFMKLFYFCYPIDEDSELLFFPWFVANKDGPKDIDPHRMTKIGKLYISVQLDCIFNSRIPVNAFEKILVQVQKTAVEEEYGGNRYTWKDGLLVEIGSIECVAIRRPEESTISICVRGRTQDLRAIWQVMFEVHKNMKSSLETLRGIQKTLSFLCSHCLLKCINPVRKWSSEEVLSPKGPSVSYVKCNGEEIPRALVAFSEMTDGDIENVKTYLKDTCTEVALPDKLLYLDCREIAENQTELSWGWPSSKGGSSFSEVVDTSIMHAKVEYKDDDECWIEATHRVQKPHYIFQGQAREFRVAAVNKNGQGEYLYINPTTVRYSDERPVDYPEDLEALQINHDSFCRMSNVRDVVFRLYRRGVINNDIKETAMTLIRDGKPQLAADKLMEFLRRLTYQALYLFKKTLFETGQIILAENVPVRRKDAGV